ncbi:MAG: MBOAT family protein [Cytophagaceae bacterium]
MKNFLPEHLPVFIIVCTVLIFIVFGGFLIMKMQSYKAAIALAWTILIFTTTGLERLSSQEPAGFRMLVIIFAMLFSMKIIVSVEAYKNSKKRLSLIQWLAFTLGWFGMRPALFESLGRKALEGGKELIAAGLLKLSAGLLLIACAKWISVSYSFYGIKFLITALLLSGISLVLHFGILNISAGFWRLQGVDARTLFKAPLLSTSLSEFWDKRWNIAFSEMTALAVYRPLKNKTGVVIAMLMAFLFSGLLHEMAISIPVKAGFGLPLLYFFIHGMVMLLERQMELKGFPVDKHTWLGRCWVIAWMLLPVPFLFHKPFIKGIIWPMIGL